MYWYTILGAIFYLFVYIGIKKVYRHLKGKKFAVLGHEHVGKTVLIKFLTEGVFTTIYNETVLEEDTPKNVLRLGDLKLIIKESKDVTGGEEYGFWKNIYEESNIALYLFRLDLFLSGESTIRIKRDINQIERWKDQSKNKKRKIIVIGTFADKVEEIDYKDDRSIERFRRKLLTNDIINEIIMQLGGGRKVPLLLGSMKDEVSTLKLVHCLVKLVV